MKNPLVPQPETTENKTSSRPQILSRFDSADSFPFDLKNQCAIDICGNPEDGGTPSDIERPGLPLLAGISDFFTQEIKPELEKTADLRVERSKKLAARFAESLPRLSSLQLPKSYAALLNVFWVLKQSEPRALLMGSAGKYTINDDAIKNVLPLMPDDERQFLKDATLDLYNSDEAIVMSALSRIKFIDLLSLSYPSKTTQEAGLLFAKDLLDPIRALKAQFPELPVKIPQALLLLEQGKDLAPESVSEISSSLVTRYIYKAVTEKSDFYSQRRIPVAKIVADAQANGLIEKMKFVLNDQATLAKQKERMLTGCELNLNKSLWAAPQSSDVEYVQLLITPIKKSVIQYAQSLTTDSTLKTELQAKIENLQFNFPLMAQEILPALKSQAEDAMTNEKSYVDAIDKFDDKLIFMSLALAEPADLDNLFLAAGATCKTFLPTKISDAAISVLGKVNISWQTLKYPSFGIGVLAHEMGHVASSVFQRAQENQREIYTSVRECLVNRHKSFDELQGALTKEEDFADLTAAQTLKDLRSQGIGEALGGIGPVNYGCMLLGNDGTRWGNKEGLALKNLESNPDVHSAALLRTVQLQLALEGKASSLPKSCQAIIKTYSPSVSLVCGE